MSLTMNATCKGGVREIKQFQLNTWGCCFICLKEVECPSEGETKTLVSLSAILKYLDLNFKELSSLSETATEILDVVVEVCSDCEKICRRTLVLLGTRNLIEMQVDHCLNIIQSAGEKGNSCPNRHEAYQERMETTGTDNGFISESVRSAKLKCSAMPKVVVTRMEIRSENTFPLRNLEEEAQIVSESENEWSAEMESTVEKAEGVDNGSDSDISIEHKIVKRNRKSKSAAQKMRIRRLVMRISNKKFECKICHKTYSFMDNVFRHIKAAHFGIKFQCRYPGCSKSFLHRSTLVSHESEHYFSTREGTQSGGDRHRKGGVSRKSVGQKQRLFSRNKVRLRNKKFECDICHKTFSEFHNVTRHRNAIHLGIKFQCRYPGCSESFLYQSTRTNHEDEFHANINPEDVTCNICNKKFRTRKCLLQHIRRAQHPKPTKYICEKCKKVFISSSQLKRHKDSFHSGVKYPCTVPGCKKIFHTKNGLSIHLSKFHKCRSSETEQFSPLNTDDNFKENCLNFSSLANLKPKMEQKDIVGIDADDLFTCTEVKLEEITQESSVECSFADVGLD